MDTIARLQRWYVAQCNGDWEHQSGVHIDTLDNPGWMVKIDLEGTELLDRPFKPIDEGTGRDGHPEQRYWIDCFVRDRQWQGAGDDSQLERILILFLNWAGPPQSM